MSMMKMIQGKLHFLQQLATYCFYLLSFVCPRNPKKWVYGSYFRFSDNSKFLFIESRERHLETRHIWIAKYKEDVALLRAKGYEAYYYQSFMGIYHSLTAKVWVSNASVGDINKATSGNAFFLNLWHGVGMKKVRWLEPERYVERFHLKSKDEMMHSFRFRVKTFWFLFRSPDLCLVPSHFQAEHFFSPMMRIPASKILLGSYPRNKLIMAGKEAAKDFIRKHESKQTLEFVNSIEQFDRIYIYMPTWRNDSADFISEAEIDWQALNDALKGNNALFLLRLHPHTKIDLSSVRSYSNIMEYQPGCDIYTVLPFTDCLITDYSSIYSDYSLMNKEIILFVYDYDKYVKNSYELQNYDTYYPGIKARTFKELLGYIATNKDCHVDKEEHDFIMKTYWDSIDNNVDIVDEVKKRIGLK